MRGTGRWVWSRPLESKYRLGRPLALNQTPPIPTSHGLLVSDWQQPQYLVDYTSGEQRVRLDGHIGYYSAFAAVHDDVMYCARRYGNVALRLPSGEVKWRVEEKSRSTSAGIVVDDKFIFTSSNGLRALSASTGEEVWRAGWSNAGFQNPAPVAWGDLILANGTRLTGHDLKTGQVRFTIQHAKDRQRFRRSQRQSMGSFSTPFVAGDFAYYGHDDTSVRAIDRQGEVVWEFVVGTPIKTWPAVSGNLLFVHDFAGNLWCFAPAAE